MLDTLIHGVGTIGFAGLAAALTLTGGRRVPALLLALACLIHALWTLAPVAPGVPAYVRPALETARPLAWAIAFVALSVTVGHRSQVLAIAGGAAVLLVGKMYTVFAPGATGVLFLQAGALIDLAAVAVTLVALLGVFRAAGESERWALKFLAFPLLAVFGYDLVLYTFALSVGNPGPALVAARSLLTALAVPPIALGVARLRSWGTPFQVSHQAALYSTGLIAVGAYLLVVAVASLLVRNWPGLLPPAVQIGLLFVSALALMFFLTSGQVRAHLKFFVSRHFFTRKYDYQHEWRKLIRTLAEGGGSPLENRVIRACANLLEVPGGALWLLDNEHPRLQATWNYRPPTLSDRFPTEVFYTNNDRLKVVRSADLQSVPALARSAEAWVVIPLPQGSRIVGILVLCHPRARHDFDAEDGELILLAAHQCASQLAEKQATIELEENRQFARFNRQYAFVAHDIKNLMSQLSVMLKNFDRYADNPEFQRDMKDTVANTVARMQQLVERLNAMRDGRDRPTGEGRASAADGAREAVRQFEAAGRSVTFGVASHAQNLLIAADQDRYVAILGHLIANACEATGPDGTVWVEVDTRRDSVIVEVGDDGPGMSADFIHERLFAPFHSNKHGGFGVGVYQCREFARERGGDLDVISSPGSGTTMRLRLPVVARAEEPGEVETTI